MKKSLLVILAASLCSFHLYAPLKMNEKSYVKFGESGGFTGEAIEYTLLPNRILEKMLPNDRVDFVQTLPKSEMRYILTNLKKLKKKFPNFNKPGNMTHYLMFHNGKTGKDASWTWGETGFEVPDELEKFQGYLMGLR